MEPIDAPQHAASAAIQHAASAAIQHAATAAIQHAASAANPAETAANPAPKDERPPSPFAILFAPDRAMDRQARIGRARWLFLFAWLSSILLAAAVALRVDAAASTLRKLDMSGQLKSMSDRQIADDIHSAERLVQVATIAKGILGIPLQLGLSCLAVLVLAWFFKGRIKGSAVAPVAAATLLPGALANLLDAASAYQHAMLPPEGAPLSPRSLSAVLALFERPLMGHWVKFGAALDFFSLWAAVITGFGVAAAAGVPRRTAVFGTLVAWVCYQLIVHVATGGAARPQ